jgi:hypothetical protein
MTRARATQEWRARTTSNSRHGKRRSSAIVEILAEQEHAAIVGKADEVLAPFVLDLLDADGLAGAHNLHQGDARDQVGLIETCRRRLPWPESHLHERQVARDYPDQDMGRPGKIRFGHQDHCHERRDHADEQSLPEPTKRVRRPSAQERLDVRAFRVGKRAGGLLDHAA